MPVLDVRPGSIFSILLAAVCAGPARMVHVLLNRMSAWFLLTPLLVLLASGSSVAQQPRAHVLPPLVFTHVTVVDATGRPPQSDMTVVITGDRITSLGRSADVNLPRGARVIDGSGKFLIPGLWDMHVHLSYSTETAFPALITNGITSVRDMGGDLRQIDRWRKEIARGDRQGPRILRAGPFVDGPKPEARFRRTVTSDADARQAVGSLKRQGVDFIKVHNALPRDAFRALAREARRQRVPFAVHLPRNVSMEEASAAGASSLEHTETLLEGALYRPNAIAKTIPEALDEVRGETGQKLFVLLRRNGTRFVPTLVAYHRAVVLTAETEQSRIGRSALHRDFVKLVGAMHRAGVSILAGSDFADTSAGIRPGVDLHGELALFVEAGMSPMEALQSATRNPARFLGLAEVGTVERGKVADLVLLDANPMENIGNTRRIAAVVVRGKLVSIPMLRDSERGASSAVPPVSAPEPGQVRCFALRLGPWSLPLQSGGAASHTPPAVIRLDSASSGSGWMRLAPDIFGAADRRYRRDPRWRRLPGDSLLLKWSNGFVGVTLRLRDRGDGLDGEARADHDVKGPEVPVASGTGSRTACPSVGPVPVIR